MVLSPCATARTLRGIHAYQEKGRNPRRRGGARRGPADRTRRTRARRSVQPAAGLAAGRHGRAVPALGRAHLARPDQLHDVGERRHQRGLGRQLLGTGSEEAAHPVHRAGRVPQPARVRAGLAVEDPRYLQHQARLPRRAADRRAQRRPAPDPLHDRRPAAPRRERIRIFQLVGVLEVRRAHRRHVHPGRLRRVQLRQLP